MWLNKDDYAGIKFIDSCQWINYGDDGDGHGDHDGDDDDEDNDDDN